MSKIVLATGSEYRKKVFERLGIPFEMKVSGIDEEFSSRPQTPNELVMLLSKMKVEAVAQGYKDSIVIGFDSVGWFNGRILEKPQSLEEASERLQLLSGNNFQFYTGVYMKNLENGKYVAEVSKTDAWLRVLSPEEIKKYLDEDQDFKEYAHGFDANGHYSSTFIRRIEGSYLNITRGIPLELVVDRLSNVGYEL